MRAVIQNSVGEPDVLVIADQSDPTPNRAKCSSASRSRHQSVDGAVRAGYYP